MPRHIVRDRNPLLDALGRLHGQVLQPELEAVWVGELKRRRAQLCGREGAVSRTQDNGLEPILWP